MTHWNLKTHTHGKVYEVNMANMNAMIADIERLQKVAEAAGEVMFLPDWNVAYRVKAEMTLEKLLRELEME